MKSIHTVIGTDMLGPINLTYKNTVQEASPWKSLACILFQYQNAIGWYLYSLVGLQGPVSSVYVIVTCVCVCVCLEIFYFFEVSESGIEMFKRIETIVLVLVLNNSLIYVKS